MAAAWGTINGWAVHDAPEQLPWDQMWVQGPDARPVAPDYFVDRQVLRVQCKTASHIKGGDGKRFFVGCARSAKDEHGKAMGYRLCDIDAVFVVAHDASDMWFVPAIAIHAQGNVTVQGFGVSTGRGLLMPCDRFRVNGLTGTLPAIDWGNGDTPSLADKVQQTSLF